MSGKPVVGPLIMIRGISHITLIVRDLDKTARLFCEGLGAMELYDSKEKNFSVRREKFFVLGGVWLVAMEGDRSEKSYRHIAFQVEEDDLREFEERLIALGAMVVPSRSRVEGEGSSLYFYDYDNNFYELHSGTLEERLKKYTGRSDAVSLLTDCREPSVDHTERAEEATLK